ncbi:MAG: nucleotidyl transferase AbiEii/AbiGii toxin family protein [Fibrobacteraceae bacterium]|nr:nucleotidyl transferase AbiEii/AbiGii toxin family protein [Fibrobacteraceae bacterium]
MNALETMLKRYDCKNTDDYRNALKEIVQEVALCGLSRGNFFRKAAFYGGSALRIFYGLDRFSEDLDFSLTGPDVSFDLADYFPALEAGLSAAGFSMTIESKEKKYRSATQSAFLKGNTLLHLLKIAPLTPPVSGVPENEVLKIKFEVDTNPPALANYQNRYALLPSPFAVRLYDEPSLFAGKIHAVLCRAWKNRVKGRDFYDYVWYLSRGTKVNLPHLQKRLEQTGNWNAADELSLPRLKDLLCSRFLEIDFENAKLDVKPFISDVSKLDLWDAGFFEAITKEKLQGQP